MQHGASQHNDGFRLSESVCPSLSTGTNTAGSCATDEVLLTLRRLTGLTHRLGRTSPRNFIGTCTPACPFSAVAGLSLAPNQNKRKYYEL